MNRFLLNLSRNTFVVVFVFLLLNKECSADEVSDLTTQALSALKRRSYDISIKCFDKLIQLNAPDAYLGRAKAFFEKHEYDKAMNDINEAIRIKPSAFAYGCRANTYSKMGDYEKAANDYSEAIRRDPENGDYYMDRAQIYVLDHQNSTAIIDFNTAILIFDGAGLTQSLATAYSLRGQVYLLQGDDKCFSSFNKSIQINSTNSDLYLYRGQAFTSKKEYSKSIEDYNTAIKLNPTNAAAYANRGASFAYKGFCARGIEDCSKAIQLDPNCAVAYAQLALILGTGPDSKIRDGKRAVEYAKKACELTSWKDSLCLDALASSCAEAGNFEEAVKWGRESLKFNRPENEVKQAQNRLDLYKQGKPYHLSEK